MGSQQGPFNSPFVTSSFSTRKKGFGERFVDEISDLTLKQTLGLPLSVPLTLGAGAVKGVSFGLLDPTDDVAEGLGEFALPETATTALDIAGQIGGSFIPYVGASKVAGTVFKGLSLGQKLATGAFTFGAPHAAQQALTQEWDPASLARSVATGAAFALPLPRLALAPAVAGTELLFGAEPIEAGAAGLFAGIFGPMGSHRKPGLHQELPVSSLRMNRGVANASRLGTDRAPSLNPNIPETAAAGPSSPLFPSVEQTLAKFTTAGARPQANAKNVAAAQVALSEELANAMSPAGAMPTAAESLQKLSGQSGRISKGQRRAAEVGQLELQFTPPAPPKTQIELLESAMKVAPPQEQATLRTITAAVKERQAQTPEALMSELNTAIDTVGPESVQARVARLALAQKQGGFVPPGAPMRNPLKPPVRGVNTIENGPDNPYEVRAMMEDLMMNLRATGGAQGRTREAQLWDVLLETRQKVARARGRGQELPKEEIGEATRRQRELMAGKAVQFKTEEEAYRTALLELGNKSSAGDVDAFVENLPEYYRPLQQRLLTAGRDQKRMLVEVEAGAQQFRKTIDRQPAGFKELMSEASDAGMSIVPAQRATVRAGKPRTVIDSFELLGTNGQSVKKFNSVEASRRWLRELEAGAHTPENIHELRSLAHGRGIVIDALGSGELTLTNQLTGETVQGIKSLQEAVEIVRRAPNVAAAAREIGPRATAHPPLPGSGGLGGLASEQSPPAALCSLGDIDAT